MSKKIYLTGIEKSPGKSFVSLGLLSALKEQQPNLCCYKLFSEIDNSQISLLEMISQISIAPLMNINEAIMMMREQSEDFLAQVFETLQKNEKQTLSYFEGSDFESDNDNAEFQFNLKLAAQLNCEVIVIISAKDRTPRHLLSLLCSALETGKKYHANIIGVVFNRVETTDENALQELFSKRLPDLPFISFLPEFENLAHPTVNDIANKLNAQIICGHSELHRTVRQFTVAAKTIDNFLQSRQERNGMLIITPFDRVDILLGSLLADQSAHYPKIAGIVLTGGEMPGKVIREIIAGLEQPFPVLLTQNPTYETATLLYSAKFSLTKEDMPKVFSAIDAMKPYLLTPLIKLLKKPISPTHLSPAIFLYELIQKAKQNKRHIVLPEGHDPRILTAASHLLKRDIVTITLLGNRERITLLAKRLDLELPNIQIINIEQSPNKERYAQQYFELRKHKNINLPIALERMTDVNFFAAMMVYNNDADGMVSGAIHTTADTVRPALEIIKTKQGIDKVSSIFIMCLPSHVLIYGDCAINPEPNSETLAETALQAVDIAERLGIEPRVALLSYSSGDSGKGESVEKVSKAMTLLRNKKPNLLAEGPIQYDAAVDPEVARSKLPHSQLAGKANVLIFPDLNTGNNTYKAVQRESGALAIGPVLLGLNKPVNDLSRGCSAQDIINTILVTAIQVEVKKS